jgi:CRP/FNR family transcriptional regulator
LRPYSLTDELDEWELRTLQALSIPRSAAPGGLIFSEGDEGSEMLLVVSGHLRVTKGKSAGTERVLGDIGPGDVIGEVGLLLGRRRSASVFAVDEVQALIIDRAALERLTRHAPRLASKIMLNLSRLLCQRLLDRERSIWQHL